MQASLNVWIWAKELSVASPLYIMPHLLLVLVHTLLLCTFATKRKYSSEVSVEPNMAGQGTSSHVTALFLLDSHSSSNFVGRS